MGNARCRHAKTFVLAVDDTVISGNWGKSTTMHKLFLGSVTTIKNKTWEWRSFTNRWWQKYTVSIRQIMQSIWVNKIKIYWNQPYHNHFFLPQDIEIVLWDSQAEEHGFCAAFCNHEILPVTGKSVMCYSKQEIP